MSTHIIKLVVGVQSLSHFAQVQERYLVPYKDGLANPVWTRNTPKQAQDILDYGGSMYRVIKNQIVFRHKILGFEQVEHEEKGRMCMIMTSPEIIRTVPTPKRPFQGWRYLKPEDAPHDIGPYSLGEEEGQSPEVEQELLKLGLL